MFLMEAEPSSFLVNSSLALTEGVISTIVLVLDFSHVEVVLQGMGKLQPINSSSSTLPPASLVALASLSFATR